jgi:hypothetical protein
VYRAAARERKKKMRIDVRKKRKKSDTSSFCVCGGVFEFFCDEKRVRRVRIEDAVV